MLDVEFIRENPKEVKEGVRKKQVGSDLVDDFLEIDEEWRGKKKKLDDLREKQNKISEKISQNRDEELISEAKDLKKKIQELEDRERNLHEKRGEILAELPNLPFEEATVGKDEDDNVVIREEGDKPDFGFEPQDHLEIGRMLGLIDTQKASEVAGSRFNYLTSEAVLMEFALVQLAMNILTEEGFKPIIPPVMAKPDVMRRMGKGKFLDEDDAFYVCEDELYLVGSSEHTIGPFHMEDVLSEPDLPKRYVGFSSCFRREAGSYGKDTRGILRVHQFDKVEMLSFAHPDESRQEHEFLLSMQEALMKKLDLPYQVVEICTGDMTWADARQFDIKAWIPSQERYRETNSCSNTTDYQSRGISAKFEDEDGAKKPVHMLNGTAVAIGRIIIAILENYQNKDGSVDVPGALQDYVGKERITE